MSYTTAARPGDQIKVTLGSPRGPARSPSCPGRASSPAAAGCRAGSRAPAASCCCCSSSATLVYLAVGRAQALPRSARIKRLVRAHTDPRGGYGAARAPAADAPDPLRRPRPAAARPAPLRARRAARRDGGDARCPPRRSSSARSILAILLAVIGAGIGAGSPVVYLLLFVAGLVAAVHRAALAGDAPHPSVRERSCPTCSARSRARCASVTA